LGDGGGVVSQSIGALNSSSPKPPVGLLKRTWLRLCGAGEPPGVSKALVRRSSRIRALRAHATKPRDLRPRVPLLGGELVAGLRSDQAFGAREVVQALAGAGKDGADRRVEPDHGT
jgi:hypothetical protein